MMQARPAAITVINPDIKPNVDHIEVADDPRSPRSYIGTYPLQPGSTRISRDAHRPRSSVAGRAAAPTPTPTPMPVYVTAQPRHASQFVEHLPEYRPYTSPISPHKRQPRSPVVALRRMSAHSRRHARKHSHCFFRHRSQTHVSPQQQQQQQPTLLHSHSRIRTAKLRKRPPARLATSARCASYSEWRQSMLEVVSADVTRRASTRSRSSAGGSSGKTLLSRSGADVSGEHPNAKAGSKAGKGSGRRRSQLLSLLRHWIRCGHPKIHID